MHFKRPGRLFWKILGVFWLTLIISLMLNIYITRQLTRIELNDEHLHQQLLDMGQTAVLIYEQRGEEGLRKWYRRMLRTKGALFALRDQQGQLLAQPDVKRQKHDEEDDDDDHRPWRRHPEHFSLLSEDLTITGEQGDIYHLQLLDSPFAKKLLDKNDNLRWVRLLGTMFVVALASWWLSRHIGRPVQQLTQASRSMMEGNLRTRVADTIGKRRDELGELATSFDDMANHLERQITGQKQLLRDISHELRTPLTRQQIAIELLRQGQIDDALLDSIERQNAQLNELLDDVLTLNRLQEDQTQLHLCPLALDQHIQNAVQDALLEARQRDIQIITQLQPGTVMADDFLLNRVWNNLLSNSLKYSHSPSTIQIRMEETEAWIHIIFEDEGPGIEEQHLDKLGTPFYRCDQARQSQGKPNGGYGLGLAIVHSTVRRHGGTVSIDNRMSNEGISGLSVRIKLPKP